MKGSKIKVITMILVIVLISLVGFIGVYTHVQNRMKNQVKDYDFSMDIKGARNIVLKLSAEDESSETENAETDGEESTENETSTEKVNKPEKLTKENYELSKQIIEERLKAAGVPEYRVRLNEETGDISLEMPENGATDEILSSLVAVSNFEIQDAETGEVLMTKDKIENVQVLYGSTSETAKGTSVILNIQFNKEGTSKLEEITTNYTPAPSAATTPETENTTETNTTTQEDTAQSGDESTDTTEEKEKKVKMVVDGQEIMSSSFEKVIKNGALQITYGQASTDNEVINENAEKANAMAQILKNRVMPLKYEYEENKYIQSDITEQSLQKIEIIVAVVAIIALLLLVVKYKANGVLASIAYIGLAALLLLTIRYTNIVLSIEGIAAIVVVLILNYIFTGKFLKEIEDDEDVIKAAKLTYKDFFIKIIPVIIMSIAFCFINWLPINSFGMVMFWGIVLIALYNFIITTFLLKLNMGGTNNETK